MALLRNFSKIFLRYRNNQTLLNAVNDNCAICCRMSTYHPLVYENDKPDPAPLFFRKDIQALLKSLTRIDLNRVFRKRKSGEKRPEDPVFKFLTDEELKEAIEESKRKADEMLQIPPVLRVRSDVDNVLSSDPALKGLETSRFVFTDISFGIKDSERVIVVREPDGTLREAEWTLKDRMNQVYFPKALRELKMPKMFQDENLKSLLERKEYEFILDRACLQFEPNDSQYQKVTTLTYQHLNDNNDFEALRSTRHFGSLVFFLVWNKNIDNLLLDVVETSHIEEGKDLITLYGLVNGVKFEQTRDVDMLKEYIKKHASKKGALELALQAYSESIMQKEELDRGIKAAHGIS